MTPLTTFRFCAKCGHGQTFAGEFLHAESGRCDNCKTQRRFTSERTIVNVAYSPFARVFPLLTALLLSCVSWAQPIPPVEADHADDSTNDFGHVIRFSWPETSEPSDFRLDGVPIVTTSANSLLVSNISAPWPKTASVSSGTNFWTLRFSVEHVTRWSGQLNESANPSGPFTPSGLLVGQRITGPSRFFAAVLTQRFEVVPWTSGPWGGPQY